jgi:uncharacterized protein YecT (DUF1311 family)
MRVSHLVPLLLTSLSAIAHATDSPFECKYDGNQQEMNACAVRDYKAADRVLNAKYKQLKSALPPANQEVLLREQRAWLKKRDPRCRAEAKLSEGGSIWPLEYFSCLKSVTEERTKQLELWQVTK